MSGPAGTPCPACESTTGCDCDEYDVLGAIVERDPIPASPVPLAPVSGDFRYRGHRIAPAPAAPVEPAPFIPSRGEIGAPPAAEAPAPWRWEEWECNSEGLVVDESWSRTPVPGRPVKVWNLRDARGGLLLTTQDDVPPASPRVRALTEAAPDIEARLLAALDMILRLTPFAFAGTGGPALPTKVDVDDVYRSGRELLARIDERSKP